jgi:signal transduction histidine kinase/DNA-binding response OmpR family regulator
MSIRAKAGLIIAAIVVLITAANFATSFFFTERSLLEGMQNELGLARDIADDLVSTKINLLKSDAQTVAAHLEGASNTQIMDILYQALHEYPDFMAFTVFDREKIVAARGYATTPLIRLNEKYVQSAFNGETVMSTTRRNQETGEIVMHVCAPIGEDRVLSVTISGMIFSRLLEEYKLWGTGGIVMIDEDGTVIASFTDSAVADRANFFNHEDVVQKLDIQAKDTIESFFQRMTMSDEGFGQYTYKGGERFCTYIRVSGSTVGWKIAVLAPLAESPARNVHRGLLASAMVFVLAGMIIAFTTSNIIVRPFYMIQRQKKHLEALNETVLAASEAKSRFLANMSHEMRTPLNAIIGLSELTLDGEELQGESAANLENIYNAGMTLLGTVNDILDISKIESGKFEIIPVDYELPSLINDTVMQNILRIGEKPIVLRLDIDDSLPCRLYGDELRIRQLLNNLLSNAFKYTRKGTVDLGISCEREGDIVWLTASVTDTGIGIRPEDVDKLFSDYSQVDTKANRKIEGTGLGLAITKSMVELMGGGITVESEYGKGSTFTFRIKQGFITDEPIGASVADSLRNFRHFNQKKDRHTKLTRIRLPYARVLVVDDVPANLDVARGMMKPYGMQIDCVTSGPAAIERIRAKEVIYSAIFMDHMMPGMDGIEATKIIREEIDTLYAKTIPIIALTANAIRGNDKMFLQNGFNDFISKPIDLMRLDAVIRQWVRDKEQEKKLLPEESVKEKAEAKSAEKRLLRGRKIEGLDLEAALERFGDDENSLLTVLSSYARGTPQLLEQIQDVKAENLPHYATIVHGIKGSSRGICAEAAGSLAESLEHAAKAGNFDFVSAHNNELLELLGRLLADMNVLLAGTNAENKKPVKDAPDPAALTKLREACIAFDIDEADKAMAELESYEYKSQQELVPWIRESINKMQFKKVAEKLTAVA